MKCPYCGMDQNKVQIKHELEDGSSKRKRVCLLCGKRFNTLERYSVEEESVYETQQEKTN